MFIILFEVFVYEEYNKNEKNLFCSRKKLVTEPDTYYSGQKTYYRVVSWREQ